MIAGIGNFWKSEGCFAAGVDPWRPAGQVSDEEALAIVAELRPRMQASAARRPAGSLAADLQRGRAAVPALRAAGADQAPRAGRRQPADVLVSELPALRRVGHKGADHIAPGNTAASFDAALAAGVDMIEFDVLPEDMHRPADSRLLLAHDYTHDLAHALTLEEGLAHLAEPFATSSSTSTSSCPGYEARVVEALRAHGLVERALISTTFMRSLVAVRELEPRLRLGWSVPRARRDYTAVVAAPSCSPTPRSARIRAPAAGRRPRALGGRALRRADGPLAARLAAAGGDGQRTPAASSTCGRSTTRRASGGSRTLGVTGVITNDPRLFYACDGFAEIAP